MSVVLISVPGRPQPRGSKTAVPLKRGGEYVYERDSGRRRARRDRRGRRCQIFNTIDDNSKSGPWMEVVATVAKAQYRGPAIQGPVICEASFRLVRPKYHFGTGRNSGKVKPAYLEAVPEVKPDLTKLWRAVEDALAGIVFADDAKVVGQQLEKVYCDTEREQGVTVIVQPFHKPKPRQVEDEQHRLF